MSSQRDKEIAEQIREMIALGDPRWRKAALSHLKQMMDQADSAETVAKVIKNLSERINKS